MQRPFIAEGSMVCSVQKVQRSQKYRNASIHVLDVCMLVIVIFFIAWFTMESNVFATLAVATNVYHRLTVPLGAAPTGTTSTVNGWSALRLPGGAGGLHCEWKKKINEDTQLVTYTTRLLQPLISYKICNNASMHCSWSGSPLQEREEMWPLPGVDMRRSHGHL